MGLSKHHKTRLNDTGSVLISLIITMVVLAALGAAMVSLTSTSMFGQVGANSSARAYFLAESGYRYAENMYLNPGTGTTDNALENLHDKSFILNNNAGQFDLKVYPYYFKILSNPIGTNTLSTKVIGGFPAEIVISQGWLKIGTKASNIYFYNSAVPAGANVTFTMDQSLPFFSVDTDVLPVARSVSSSPPINEGETLSLPLGSAEAFPHRNGVFQVKNHVYAYKEKVSDSVNDRLIGVTDPKVSPMLPLTVDANSDIILQKFIKLHSTGIVGQGSVEGAARREVVYHVPLPSATEERKEFKETFEDLTNWKSSTIGTFTIQTIGGDKALRVTGAGTLGGAPKASLIRFDPSELNIDLPAAHRYGDPYFLSYDAQVKVGFDSSTTPDYGFDPVPIPVYYAAGLLFRLDDNNNSYGLSFLRGSNATDPTPDNIDNGMVPLDQKSMIVLWQLTDSGATAKWLAYKKDLALFFKDNFESEVSVWTTVPLAVPGPPPNLWHPTTRNDSQVWYYGREDTRKYNTGNRNGGSLISPDINLSAATSATLTYRSSHQTEAENPLVFDLKYVEVSTDGGVTWAELERIPGTSSGWQQRSVSLSAYRGQTIKIRFRFDTGDALFNDYEGWYIDDVRIAGDTAASVNEATLSVRIKEAASVTFTNGNYGGGADPIENSDTVVGQTSGARGVVSEAPVVSSGSWAAGNAAGTLILKNTTGTFSAGEQLRVNGSAAAATVSGYRARDNFIRAYYGTALGYGAPDSSPLNDEKRANPRGTVNWPPDDLAEWSSTTDFFTLVQWDAVNTGVTRVGSLNEPNAIIRDDTLTSPVSGPLQQPELGLHTFGKGSTNVYFDDFAIQTDVGAPGNVGFARTIQQ